MCCQYKALIGCDTCFWANNNHYLFGRRNTSCVSPQHSLGGFNFKSLFCHHIILRIRILQWTETNDDPLVLNRFGWKLIMLPNFLALIIKFKLNRATLSTFFFCNAEPINKPIHIFSCLETRFKCFTRSINIDLHPSNTELTQN